MQQQPLSLKNLRRPMREAWHWEVSLLVRSPWPVTGMCDHIALPNVLPPPSRLPPVLPDCLVG